MDQEQALDVLYDDKIPLGDHDAGTRARYAQAVTIAQPTKSPLSARYKVEVHLNPVKGQRQPFTGMLFMVLSGSDKTFDLDQPVYLCPMKECRKLIMPWHVTGGIWMCPSCGTVGTQDAELPDGRANQRMLSDGTLFRASESVVARLIHQRFLLLGQDAHVFLRRHKAGGHDWVRHYMACEWAEYEKARRAQSATREWAVYPAESIRRDNLSGCDMEARFLTFLRA